MIFLYLTKSVALPTELREHISPWDGRVYFGGLGTRVSLASGTPVISAHVREMMLCQFRWGVVPGENTAVRAGGVLIEVFRLSSCDTVES